MVDRGVLRRIRQQRDLTAYHRRLTADIGRWPALQALPQLLKMALPIVNLQGAFAPLRATLAEHRFVTLAGRSGAGRGLVMQQLALYHVRRVDPAGPLPALLELPDVDDGRSPPAQLLDATLSTLMQRSEPDQARRLLGALAKSAGLAERADDWLLFVHGWEQLPEVRRAVWRETLLGLAARSAGLRAVVALPAEELAWEGFHSLAVAPPPATLVSRWLDELCPAPDRPAVWRALAPDGPLAPCAERLFDVALLSWLAPRAGIPASRAHLYEQALHAVRADPQRFGSRGAPLGHALLGRYALAQRLVAEDRFRLLDTLPAPDLAETALLAAELSAEPARVLAALWRVRGRDLETALALARCLGERPSSGPLWTVRVATRLAAATGDKRTPAHSEARARLDALLPALDAALAALAQRSKPSTRLLARLLRTLPSELALPRAQAIALGPSSSEQQAWALADLLPTFGAEAGSDPPPAGTERRARWSYVQVLACSAAGVAPEDLRALSQSAAGAARLVAVGTALVRNKSLPPELRVAGLELLEHGDARHIAADVRLLCDDPTVLVRRAAHVALARLSPAMAREVLSAAVERAGSWEQRLEALQRLGEGSEEDVASLVATYARDERLPLAARLQLVQRLGVRVGPEALGALAADDTCPALVRAAAARTASGVDDGVARALLAPGAPDWLVASVCEGLAGRGRAPRAEFEPALLGWLESALDAFDLRQAGAVVGAMGAVGGDASMAVLAELVDGAVIEARMHRVLADLLDQPPALCLVDARLPEGMRLGLETALARGLTHADTPSILREFLATEVDRLRAAAARALGTIGNLGSREALRAPLRGGASEASRACIAAIGALEGLETLADLLGAPAVPQGVRWQIAKFIEDDPAGESVMRAALERPGIDPFTRGALVEGLGRRGAGASLLALTRLLRDPVTEPHVRSQAVAALGLLDEPATEPALLRVFADSACPLELRGQAAECLPQSLSDEGRQRLRETLRTEQVPEPLVVGALRALGRARDREALALAMRFCLDDRPDVVRAAIGALADIGEETVTPVLARAAQSPGVEHVVRIQAIGALMRLSGGEHRLLLQPFLDHSSPLLQLRALDALIAGGASAQELAGLAADPARALPLRLRALERVAAAAEAVEALVSIAERGGDQLQLRLRAVIALGEQRYAAAAPTLAALAQTAKSDGSLRFRCVEALGRIGGSAAGEALSRLAEDEGCGAARTWAGWALQAGEAL